MAPRMILLWIFLGGLFLLGVYLIFMNYYAWIYPFVTRKKGKSPLPLIGGLLCNASMRVCPIAGVRSWAWLAWLVDPGCVFLLGVFIYTAIATKGFQAAPPKQCIAGRDAVRLGARWAGLKSGAYKIRPTAAPTKFGAYKIRPRPAPVESHTRTGY